jgi:UDP-N-acetyl-D-mannosaminuronate dehydrogenase
LLLLTECPLPTPHAGGHCDVVDPFLLYLKFLDLKMTPQIWAYTGIN